MVLWSEETFLPHEEESRLGQNEKSLVAIVLSAIAFLDTVICVERLLRDFNNCGNFLHLQGTNGNKARKGLVSHKSE
jgi:hypothetical protein